MKQHMKMVLAALAIGGTAITATGCGKNDDVVTNPTPDQLTPETNTSTSRETSVEGRKITLKTAKGTQTMTLVDNAATRKLVQLCNTKPITVQMHEYGGFEMVGSLPESFPTSNTQTTTTTGDVMLYNGNQLVVFFGSNTWAYTRLGHIDHATPDGVRNFFGADNANVELSLSELSKQ